MMHVGKLAISLSALALLAACVINEAHESSGSTGGSSTGASEAAPSAGSARGLPLVNATCPLGIEVHADEHGPVFINGQEAELKKFSDTYYEATRDGTTISLSINPDETVSVSYTAPGGANGICTVTS